MPAADRQKWDEKYARGEHATDVPSRVIERVGTRCCQIASGMKGGVEPALGRALELAGGAGRHSLWFAARGYDVTLTDVSRVALELARQRAAARALELRTFAVDLEESPFPSGPWDLIFSHHYLWRPLFAEFPATLAPGGLVLIVQTTVRNLERHARPPAPFLLEEGELPRLLAPLTIDFYEEGWNEEGRHEAVAVARLA